MVIELSYESLKYHCHAVEHFYLSYPQVFTENLREIYVYTNNTANLKISKKIIDASVIEIVKDVSTYSPQGIFHLKSINLRRVEVRVERNITSNSNETFSCQIENATIQLHIATGHLDVDVTETFSAEMERSIKKKPPTTTVIQMLFPEFDEYKVSVIESKATEDVSITFKDLLPYPEQGRIFIGFPTHQTTGHPSHLAARFIPTVRVTKDV